MKVDYSNFVERWKEEKKKLLPLIIKTLESGEYVGVNSTELIKFEKKIKNYFKSYVVTLNSGTDALILGMHAIGITKGDEVITPSNSYISSTAAIVHLGAKPVFVDVLPDQNIDPVKIEEAITKKTKAIMPVHLTGRSCDMNAIIRIAKKYKIHIIEDCAQAFGSKYTGKLCGTFGTIGCFSLHPLKNFSGMGDGGFLITKSKKIYNYIKKLRNHGLRTRDKADYFGYNSRLDNIQATILNFRLKKIDHIIKKRRQNAGHYIKNLDKKFVFCPPEKFEESNTHHLFVIQVPNRNGLQKYLKKKNIISHVHYPIPIHRQKMFKKKKFFLPNIDEQSKNILSLPIHHSLSKLQLEYVVECINQFYSNEKNIFKSI